MKILKIYLDKKSSDNAVLDKAFYIEDGYQHGLASMVYIYKYIYIYIYVYIYILIKDLLRVQINLQVLTQEQILILIQIMNTNIEHSENQSNY